MTFVIGGLVYPGRSTDTGEIDDAQHGERGGGLLHDVATSGAAGFMSPAHVDTLDGLTRRWEIERDLDFAAWPATDFAAGGDGNYALNDGGGSLTWTFANTANANGAPGFFRRNAADVGDDGATGLRIHHDASVNTTWGDTPASRSCPHFRLSLSSLITDFDPLIEYLVMVHITRASASGTVTTAPQIFVQIGDDGEGIANDRSSGAALLGNSGGGTWEPYGSFGTVFSGFGPAYPTTDVIAICFGPNGMMALHGAYSSGMPDPGDLLPTASQVQAGSNMNRNNLWTYPANVLAVGLASRGSYTGTAQCMLRHLRIMRRW